MTHIGNPFAYNQLPGAPRPAGVGSAPVPLSLGGTLQGADVLTLLQQAMQEQATALQGRTQAATQAANQAQQEYGNLAAAPSPQLNPLAAMIPALFGNVASVLSGNPEYSKRGQQTVQQSRAGLLKQRADNLAALRETYIQKAEEAQKAGDLEATEKYRSKIETIGKTFDLVQSNYDRANRLELSRQEQDAAAERQIQSNNAALERQQLEGQQRLAEIQEQGNQQRLTNEAKPKVTANERAAAIRAGVDAETGLRLRTAASKEILSATNQLRTAKLKGEQKNEVANNVFRITTERWNTDTKPSIMRQRLLDARHPLYGLQKKDQRYLLTDKKVWKRVQGQWVKDPEAEKEAKAEAENHVIQWFQPQ